VATRSLRLLAILLWPLMSCRYSTETAACGDARSLDASLRLPPPTSATVDDQWADLAREVPGGWGGVLLVSGRPTVYLVHTERREAALAALYAAGVGLPLFDIRTADVRQGRWDFAQLYDWYRYINVRVGTVNGVYSTDIDEERNRLVYEVDSTAKAEVEALVATLNLPCDLVVITIGNPVVPL